jgi:hypothetical protein
MGARTIPALVTKLDGVHREFTRWRRTRPRCSPIPEPLWGLAVARAREAGVHATARRLRLNYYALKQRVERAGRAGATSARAVPAFVELVPAGRRPAGSTECVIELADTRGATMRILLKSPAPPDLAALSRAFWSPRA